MNFGMKYRVMNEVQPGEPDPGQGGGGQAPIQTAPPTTGQAPVDNPGGDPAPGAADELSLEDAKKLIADLRKENADRRTKSKDLESKLAGITEKYSKVETGLKGLFGEGQEEIPPEEQVQHLQAQNEATAMRLAVLETAQEYGVGRDAQPYFEFLLTQKANDLEDDEELTEEDLQAIAQEAKSKFAPASTTVTGNGGEPPKAPATPGAGDITVDEFAAMNMGEKSSLYQKDPDLYTRLVTQAKKEGKFI